jgi:hypothetical protein
VEAIFVQRRMGLIISPLTPLKLDHQIGQMHWDTQNLWLTLIPQLLSEDLQYGFKQGQFIFCNRARLYLQSLDFNATFEKHHPLVLHI